MEKFLYRFLTALHWMVLFYASGKNPYSIFNAISWEILEVFGLFSNGTASLETSLEQFMKYLWKKFQLESRESPAEILEGIPRRILQQCRRNSMMEFLNKHPENAYMSVKQFITKFEKHVAHKPDEILGIIFGGIPRLKISVNSI